MGGGALVMDEWSKFNNQTAGRDKVFRLTQYICRIMWSTLDKKESCRNSAAKAKRVDEALGLMRRILRFGRFFETLHSALPVMSSVSDPVIRLTSVMSRISGACFMLIDHIVCLDKLGVLPPKLIDASRWDRTSVRCWLYSITLGLIRDFYEIKRIYKEEFQYGKQRRLPVAKSSTSKDGESKRVKGGNIPIDIAELLACLRILWRGIREHADVAVDTLKNICDIFLPLSILGFIKLTPTTVGLLGTVSTIASALPQINPMIKMVPAT